MTDLTEIWSATQLADYQRRTKAQKRGAKSKAMHEKFAFDCRARRLPTPHTELQFALEMLERRWRFDFAWPSYMVACELEGLLMRQLYEAPRPGAKRVLVVYGRHATIEGFKEDAIKYASAATLGWTVLRFEQSQVKDGTAIDYTLRTLHAKGWRA
jgi:very-short-patch-repair endonuclease